MNNDQFRRLMGNKPDQQDASATPRPGATPSSLGAKKSSFMPMTPRTVKGGIDVDFARQVRERNAALQPKKKFKSSAPKGSKFSSGYTDRAKARAEGEDGGGDAEDKAERIKALEEQMKLDQISPETFEKLRDQITGGDASSTHLVKGLDRQLLERVRRGEDVLGLGNGEEDKGEEEPGPDVEDELDKLGEAELEAVKKEKTEKRGIMAPPPIAGRKRTRDEIMADLKAQRKAAAEARAAADPTLNGKWAKVSDKKKPRIEIDEKGREVMITVDEKGVVKRRVRKVQPEAEKVALAVPDADKTVLGADVAIPQANRPQEAVPEDDDDGDIFEGVGAEYNPLGNADEDDDSDDSDDSDAAAAQPQRLEAQPTATPQDERCESPETSPDSSARPQSPAPSGQSTPKPVARRNYFGDEPTTAEEASHDHLSGIQEVLKKAAKMDPLRSAGEGGEGDEEAAANAARAKKHAQMLANQDRDLEDMDMGFGGSRLEDEAEAEGDGKKVKLSEWKGAGEDGWEEDDGKGGGKKKRKPKKRKGDASNMGDIMKVIEGRKGAGGK